MKVGDFSFFSRMHSNGTPIRSWVIAALHWKWSITWRWSLSFSLPPTHWSRPHAYFSRTHKHHPRKELAFNCGFILPFVGSVTFNMQPNMPDRAA